MRNIILIGAGGHTRSLLNLINRDVFIIKGIYDEQYIPDERINGIPLLGGIKDIPDDEEIILSIGNNNNRCEFYKKFIRQIVKENLIHNSCIIEKDTNIGNSNQILANSYINSNGVIGDNNIINTGATIEHEVFIGSHNHISVNSTICGRVKIGNRCFIGAGSVIIDKLTVCSDVVIGAGSTVINDITESGTYVGNPVRKVK
jgi:sugar O-acyltransferase (sialic acid O-acetyltransferase NeuD family)